MSKDEHNLLTLDFWQDEVTYGGRTQPSGAVGCAALNIPDEVISGLTQICLPASMILAAVAAGQISTDTSACKGKPYIGCTHFADVPPFSGLDCEYFENGYRRFSQKII